MYLKYSIGFLVASLVQYVLIYLSEKAGISALEAKFLLRDFITHIIAGQIAGFLLLFLLRKVDSLANASYWSVGTIYGIAVWAILIPIQSAAGTIKAPWNQGISTVLVSLIAFAIYGIIATYTIKRYGIEKAK